MNVNAYYSQVLRSGQHFVAIAGTDGISIVRKTVGKGYDNVKGYLYFEEVFTA